MKSVINMKMGAKIMARVKDEGSQNFSSVGNTKACGKLPSLQPSGLTKTLMDESWS